MWRRCRRWRRRRRAIARGECEGVAMSPAGREHRREARRWGIGRPCGLETASAVSFAVLLLHPSSLSPPQQHHSRCCCRTNAFPQSHVRPGREHDREVRRRWARSCGTKPNQTNPLNSAIRGAAVVSFLSLHPTPSTRVPAARQQRSPGCGILLSDLLHFFFPTARRTCASTLARLTSTWPPMSGGRGSEIKSISDR